MIAATMLSFAGTNVFYRTTDLKEIVCMIPSLRYCITKEEVNEHVKRDGFTVEEREVLLKEVDDFSIVFHGVYNGMMRYVFVQNVEFNHPYGMVNRSHLDELLVKYDKVNDVHIKSDNVGMLYMHKMFNVFYMLGLNCSYGITLDKETFTVETMVRSFEQVVVEMILATS